MKSETRLQDEKYVRLLEKFMDTQYAEVDLYDNMERINDAQLQKSGVDIILHEKNQDKFIDEKFAIDYRQRDLSTYSFELSSNNNKDHIGWFLNPKSKTTHYILLWFSSDKDITTIYSYTACLISKEKIKEYLKTNGIDAEKILEEFKEYWENNKNNDSRFELKSTKSGKLKRIMHLGKFRIVQSLQKDEAPINIIIDKKVLLSLAETVIVGCEECDVKKTIAEFKTNNIKTA